MAVGISLLNNPVVGVQITVTGANTGDFVHVVRTDTAGYYADAPVRGADYATPTGATMIFVDYEAPFNRALTYTAYSFSLSDLVTPTSTSAAALSITTFSPGFAIISQVFDTGERVAGGITDFSTVRREAKVLGNYTILGRNKPIIITDRFGGRTGTLKMTNFLIDSSDFGLGAVTKYTVYPGRWDFIFEDGSTLLFRSDKDKSGIPDFYFKAMSVESKRLNIVGNETNALLEYSIDFTEIDRPLTSIIGLGLQTWNVVNNANASWTLVSSKHATWADVLTNPSL